MKLREEYQIESGTRKRLYNIYTCDLCGIEYRKQQRLSQGATMEHYCSKECYYNSVSKVQLSCDHCGTNFYKLKSKLSGSKSGKYFCCRECKDTAQSYMTEIQPDHYGTGEYSYRDKAFRNFVNKCKVCDFANVDALEVHHIDTDRSNNNLSNLVILCSNCHTLVHKGKIKLGACGDNGNTTVLQAVERGS